MKIKSLTWRKIEDAYVAVTPLRSDYWITIDRHNVRVIASFLPYWYDYFQTPEEAMAAIENHYTTTVMSMLEDE